MLHGVARPCEGRHAPFVSSSFVREGAGNTATRSGGPFDLCRLGRRGSPPEPLDFLPLKRPLLHTYTPTRIYSYPSVSYVLHTYTPTRIYSYPSVSYDTVATISGLTRLRARSW
jgi:hypothetical protein